MNAKLAKEERRNLVKAMGETATDALERARAEVLQLRMEHAAIAKTVSFLEGKLLDEVSHQKGVEQRLDQRIDGASAWCEKNEKGLERLDGQVENATISLRQSLEWHVEQTTTFAERMNLIIHGGFFTRLRWVVFGSLPPVPDSAFQRANQVQS